MKRQKNIGDWQEWVMGKGYMHLRGKEYGRYATGLR